MAETNLQWETAEVDFENILLDSDTQGYLYEPQYSQEEWRQMEEEEEAAAAAAEQALPVAETRSRSAPVVYLFALRISAMPVSSRINGWIWRGQGHYASSEQLGFGYVFPDPESELE